MFAHGVYIVGLFYIVHLLEKHTGTRDIHNLGGIRNLNGQFSNLFLIILFGSIALPLTQGFVGEFLIVTGLSEISLKWAIIGGLSMIFGAVYMLRSYRSIMLGDVVKTNYTFGAMDKKDKFSLFFIAILVLLLGIYPQLLSAFAGQDILQLLSK